MSQPTNYADLKRRYDAVVTAVDRLRQRHDVSKQRVESLAQQLGIDANAADLGQVLAERREEVRRQLETELTAIEQQLRTLEST